MKHEPAHRPQSTSATPGEVIVHSSLSIIIPIYNAASTLPRTLRSLECIAEKHRARVQIILVDDGSTDTSGHVIRQFATTTTFDNTQVIQQDNAGTSAARNKGLLAATGDWILLLDADDELRDDPIKHLDRHPDASAVAFAVMLLKDGRRHRHRPRHIAADNYLDLLTAACPHTICSILFRRDCIDVPFNEAVRYLEDWLFWLENPRLYRAMHLLPGVTLAHVHVHTTNKSFHFPQCGMSRQRIAEHLLQQHGSSLTRKQRNNLLIQLQCGLLQQRKSGGWGALFRWPCSPILYLKLLLYMVMGPGAASLGSYGDSQSKNNTPLRTS